MERSYISVKLKRKDRMFKWLLRTMRTKLDESHRWLRKDEIC